MQVEVKFLCESADEAALVLAQYRGLAPSPSPEAGETKPRKTRGKSAVESLAPTSSNDAAVAGSAAMPSLTAVATDPMAAFLGGAATAPAAPAVTLVDVIAKLTLVGQKKGREGLVGVFTQFGAKDVTQLKAEQYADAIAFANKLLS